jgi:DNA-binding MarR family transcriptional regulator
MLALNIQERSGERIFSKHGTPYPILHKLEKDDLIEGPWSDQGQRGRRKSYRLTTKGRRYLKDLVQSWRGLSPILGLSVGVPSLAFALVGVDLYWAAEQAEPWGGRERKRGRGSLERWCTGRSGVRDESVRAESAAAP